MNRIILLKSFFYLKEGKVIKTLKNHKILKFVAIFFSFVICIFLMGCQKQTQIQQRDYRLVRLTSGENTSLAYLFPVYSDFQNQLGINSVQAEGYKFYLKANIMLLQNIYQEKSVDVEGVAVSEVKYYTDYDSIGFELKFDTAKALTAFFGESNEELQYCTTGFFVAKTTFNVSFPFSTTTVNNYNVMLKNVINGWGATFEIDGNVLQSLLNKYQTTTFTYETINSSNVLRAENMYKENGLYHCLFTKSAEQIAEDSEIEFYFLQINRGWWYLFALIVVVTGVVLAQIIVKKKNIQKKL